MKVVVIIPTYNEKGNIERLIKILEEEVFPEIKNHEMHILVADDSSPDGTADVVKGLMEKWKNLDINVGEKHGLGAAYIRAMIYAVDKGADVMFEMDADLQHDPKKIPQFLQKIDEGYDMVIGTRYSQGGSIPENWPLKRKIFSVFGNLLVRFILLKFSIHDWTGGYRALKKEVFLKEKEELASYPSYTFQIAFLNKAVKDGFKIAEVPFHFSDRTLGMSKFPALEYIVNALSYVIMASIKEKLFGPFGKFLVVGGTGFIIQAVILRTMVEIFKIDPIISNLAGAAAAIFSNYNLNNLWTFKTEKINGILQYLWKMSHFYLTSAIGVIIIQSGIIFLGDTLFGKKYYFLYFIFGTAILLIYNFTVYRLIIWRKKPSK
ncbi:MAG TPA: glycosyltransferase [Patescibacteria group bacterium]|jgi:dolichol-phosphate mannosyltransferase|nr:glycosyltransferase [Patescibacteria group bacterium]